jgi:O-antigen/teichoic acid export membrane protein
VSFSQHVVAAVPAPDLRRLAVGGAAVAASRLLAVVFGVVRTLVLVACLAPHALGVANLIQVILAYAALASLGIQPAAQRELLVLEGGGDANRRRIVLDTALTATAALTLLFAAGVVAAAYAVGGQTRLALAVAAVIVVLASVHTWAETLAWVGRRTFAVNALFLVLAGGGAVFVPLGAWLGGLGGALAGMLINHALTVVIALRVVPFRYRGTLDRAALLHLFAAGAPMFVAGISLLALRSVDYLLVVATRGTTEWGIYAFASLAASFVAIAATDATRVVYVHLQEWHGRGASVPALEAFIERTTWLATTAVAAAAGSLWLVVEPAVPAFFPDYAAAVPVVRVLLVGVFFYAAALQVDMYFTIVNHLWALVTLRLVLVTVNVGIGALLVATGYGIVGVAMASAAAWTLYCVARLARAGCHFSRRFAMRMLAAVFVPLAYGAVGVATAAWLLVGHEAAWVPTLAASAAFMMFSAPMLAVTARRARDLRAGGAR